MTGSFRGASHRGTVKRTKPKVNIAPMVASRYTLRMMLRTPNSVLTLELLGAVLITGLGSLLHFAFDWSGGWPPLALVAAVNESIWEHLKLAFWPGLLWGLIMPRANGLRRREVLAVKGISLLIPSIVIVTVFTTYTALLGDNLLILDIGTFVLAIIVGQLFSAWVLSHSVRPSLLLPGAFLLSVQVLAFSLFTFAPPDHWFFIEASTGLRGIPDP